MLNRPLGPYPSYWYSLSRVVTNISEYEQGYSHHWGLAYQSKMRSWRISTGDEHRDQSHVFFLLPYFDQFDFLLPNPRITWLFCLSLVLARWNKNFLCNPSQIRNKTPSLNPLWLKLGLFWIGLLSDCIEMILLFLAPNLLYFNVSY